MEIMYIGFGLLCIVSIVETVLLNRWNTLYFFRGICLFKKEIQFVDKEHTCKGISKFIESISYKDGFTNMKGKNNNNSTFFFREKLFDLTPFKFKYTPVMHGNVIIDTSNHKVIITGIMNYYIVVFCIYWYLLTLDFESLFLVKHNDLVNIVVLLCPIFIFVSCYLIQVSKYNKIVNKIKEIISKNIE